jgi:hypothetical protein
MEKVNLKNSRSNSLLVGGNRASSILSHKLEQRLASFEGKALFLTLTYRQDDYDSARDLYRSQSEERHIRMFIRRLSHYLGDNLNGRWTRKMEFTKGGFVHFHLIIDSPRFIPHSDLEQIWGHGFVWINQCKWQHIKYFTKYIAKTEHSFPPFLYNQRSRSVKIVATSPNFWRGPVRTDQSQKKSLQWAVFVPLVEVWQPKTIVKTSKGQTTVRLPLFDVMQKLISNGSVIYGMQDEYISLASCHNTIEYTLRQLKTNQCNRGTASPAGAAVASVPSLDNGLNSAHINNVSSMYQDWELRFLESTGTFHERIFQDV